MERETYTFRPHKDNVKKIEKALETKKKKEKRPTINNTIEAVLLEYFKIN